MHVSQNVLKVSRTVSLLVAIIAACVGPAMAQTNAGTTTMSYADRAFVTNMLQLSRGQVALATLVEQNSNDPAITVAAAQAAAEWSAFRSHLASIAAAAGIPYPTALTAEQQAMIAQLKSTPKSQLMLVAVNFERARDKRALEQMRTEGSTTNPQISTFISYARPELSGYDHAVATANWNGPTRAGAYTWK